MNVPYLIIAVSLRLIAMFTTYSVANRFGISKESNPIARFVFKHIGLDLGIILFFLLSLPIIWYAQSDNIKIIIVLCVFGLDAINDLIVFVRFQKLKEIK